MPVACPAERSSNSTTVSSSKTPAPFNSYIALLLLLVLILPMTTTGGYRNSSSPLQLLNPWLSACDLVDPSSAPDLQGVCLATSKMLLLSAPTTDNNLDSNNNNNNNENVNNNNVNTNTNNKNHTKVHQYCRVNGDISEGPGPPSVCPCACEDSSPEHLTSTTTPHQNINQCLDYLNESHKISVCGSSLPASVRHNAFAKLRLEHCCEHTVMASLGAEARDKVVFGNDRFACEVHIDALLELDALARSITCKFSEVLKRYDCSQPYSVNFHCADCKEAYRRWVCASLFPNFLADGAERARPCRSVCQQVEQRCPFFLPGDRFPSYPTQYAGEPTFLCLDPNIPETGGQLAKSSYGDGGCCYRHCSSEVTGFCYTDQCLSNASTPAVPEHHCEATGSTAGTSRTAVFSACSSYSATNIMVHPPLGGATSEAAHTANKTLLINLLLHIIILLVIRKVSGLEFT